MSTIYATLRTSVSLQEFVQAAFEAVSLNWRDHVDVDQSLFRPLDIRASRANPAFRACSRIESLVTSWRNIGWTRT